MAYRPDPGPPDTPPLEHILTRSIFITHQFVGLHRWPSAPLEVDYLRDRHRHLFKLRIDISVEHGDREIEYHILKRQIMFRFDAIESNFGEHSCEDIAADILYFMQKRYPDRPYYRVELSEDGENGSVVEARS